ncbi:UNVERIFIED_CONTAM: hypothetical protein FKN15_073433 [Acipenser sinensis]
MRVTLRLDKVGQSDKKQNCPLLNLPKCMAIAVLKKQYMTRRNKTNLKWRKKNKLIKEESVYGPM